MNFKTDWLENISILDVINFSNVEIQRRGNKYVGLCPFHDDKDSPSFTVYPATNSWCCFSPTCGNGSKLNGGGVISFVEQRYGLNFSQAIEWIRENFTFTSNKSILPDLTIEEKPKRYIFQSEVLYWHTLMDQMDKRSYYKGRGFTDKFIDQEMWGFNGQDYVLPIWDSEPGESTCIAIKKRLENPTKQQPKYIRFGSSEPTIWGKYYVEFSDIIYCFAGEFDAALAVQHGLPGCSLVDGAMGWRKFPNDWPELFFPHGKKLIVCFDRNEEGAAAHMAQDWELVKGKFTSSILHWPDFGGKDFSDFIQIGNTIDDFLELIQ